MQPLLRLLQADVSGPQLQPQLFLLVLILSEFLRDPCKLLLQLHHLVFAGGCGMNKKLKLEV